MRIKEFSTTRQPNRPQNDRVVLSMVTLALFHFCFLSTEYLFDNRMALFIPSDAVANAQNLMLGISVIGFVMYGVIYKRLSIDQWKVFSIVGTILCVACVILLERQERVTVLYLVGGICFALMGMAGSVACYLVSKAIKNYGRLATYIGLSYALGIFLQYCNHNWIKNQDVEAVMISLLMLFFAFCGVRLSQYVDETEGEVHHHLMPIQNPKVPLAALCASVFLMTLIFSTLDNAITMVHSEGTFDIGQWPRLLLAVSGVVAGLIYDLKNRMFMPLMMYVITMLSVISIIIIQLGGSFLFGLMVFYISAGFFVVFFIVSFMDLSYYAKNPRLWAGMGRAINNLCALVSTGLTVSLLNSGNLMTILVVAIILLIGITCCICVYYIPFLNAMMDTEKEAVKRVAMEEAASQTRSDHLSAFVTAHSFTEREKEILYELTYNNGSVSDISKELALSRASLYRHIEKMNEKTGTGSRVELLQYYYEWKQK